MNHSAQGTYPSMEKHASHSPQTVQPTRIDKHYISHEVFHLLHFEKGFFYSIKELMIRPGDTIRQYLNSDRSKHMKPVAFLVFTSLLYTLVSHALHVAEKNDRHFESSKSTDALFNWVSSHYGYANIMMGALIAVFVYLFFKKYRYNFFEILVLMCFVLGQGMLLQLVISCLHAVLPPLAYGLLFSFGIFVYAAWAIGQFFDKRKTANYFKAVLAYFLGFFVFYVLVVAVGLTSDWVMHAVIAHH